MKIACSIHKHGDFLNVGDYLSAVALQEQHTANKVCWLINGDENPDIEGDFIYGGGGMIRPDFSSREVYNHFRQIRKAHSIIGVGVNKDFMCQKDYSEEDMTALREWIIRAQHVSVRDDLSKDFIVGKVLHGNARDISVDPCPSYSLVKSLNKVSEQPRRYKVGFVPSFGHTKNYIHHIQEIHDFLKSLLDKYGIKHVLVICHDKNDYSYLRKHFPGNVHAAIVQDGPTVCQAYSSCQNTVTVRAHGVIFSAACNCNCSIINLSNKIKSLHQFHYGTGSMPDFPIFDLSFHEMQLNEGVLPLSK